MKSRQDTGLIDHTSVISTKYDTELLRLIRQCAVYDKHGIVQQHDISYRSTLC